jgi:hypothetical protein
METMVSCEREVLALTVENGWKKRLHVFFFFLEDNTYKLK